MLVEVLEYCDEPDGMTGVVIQLVFSCVLDPSRHQHLKNQIIWRLNYVCDRILLADGKILHYDVLTK